MISTLTAAQIAARLTSRELSAVEVAEAFLARIEAENPRLGAFLEVCADHALRQAKAAQERLDAGERASLLGIPIALKDNISTKGIATTCASRILEGYVPPYDAHVAELLAGAGAVLLGKTNLDEFAMGSSTETGAFGVARNPWDTRRSPGGSSGGSAAAVAGGLSPLALGSDTGGSIRQPAALCGIVGFKSTYGRCSRYGLVAFASSLDQIGPMARTVEDAALCASAITGHDRRDNTSLKQPPISIEGLKSGSIKGKRFALPKEMLSDALDAGVRASLESAVESLRSVGAVCEPVSLPTIAYGVTTYYILAPAEASSNLARFDGVRYGLREAAPSHVELTAKTRSRGFGREVKARIMIGTYTLSAGYYDAYYAKASKVRALMAQEFDSAFADFDAVLGPTCPVTAFPIGELVEDPLALKLLDMCAIPANMGGYPAISLPCGASDGLPVGLQLMGPRMSDEALLQMAYCVEQELGATVQPPVA